MRYQNNPKDHLLVDLHKLLIPLVEIGGALPRVGIIVFGLRRIILVILAPLENFLEDGLVDLKLANRLLAHTNRNDDDSGDNDNSCRDYYDSKNNPSPDGIAGAPLTLGIGIASSISPTSSSMFLIKTERSATALSVAGTRVHLEPVREHSTWPGRKLGRREGGR